jgi:hypothetical protein
MGLAVATFRESRIVELRSRIADTAHRASLVFIENEEFWRRHSK